MAWRFVKAKFYAGKQSLRLCQPSYSTLNSTGSVSVQLLGGYMGPRQWRKIQPVRVSGQQPPRYRGLQPEVITVCSQSPFCVYRLPDFAASAFYTPTPTPQPTHASICTSTGQSVQVSCFKTPPLVQSRDEGGGGLVRLLCLVDEENWWERRGDVNRQS